MADDPTRWDPLREKHERDLRKRSDDRIQALEDSGERDRARRAASHGPSDGGGAQASKIVYQIIVGLFIIMLTAIVGVLYTRQDRFDAIQQARGERVRALELQVDELQRGRSENKARLDYLYQRIFEMPATLPHEEPRRR